MIAIGAALLLPVFRVNQYGGLEGTGSTLIMVASLAALLLVATIMARRLPPGGRRGEDTAHALRGLRLICGAMVAVVILLICYHFSVPLGVGGHVRVTFVIVTASAAMAGTSAFVLASRWHSRRAAEGAMGLGSLAVCGAAVSAAPYFPGPLAERYPVVFNGMIFGLAAATALSVLLAKVQHHGVEPVAGARRMIIEHTRPLARRFAFLNAVLALLVAGVMAVWPRMRSIAVPDDSIGRVSMGLAANLFLLLVLLWSSRRIGSLTFHVLTALAIISSVAFMMMRMYPYTPRFR
jgi:hypothetical protein